MENVSSPHRFESRNNANMVDLSHASDSHLRLKRPLSVGDILNSKRQRLEPDCVDLTENISAPSSPSSLSDLILFSSTEDLELEEFESDGEEEPSESGRIPVSRLILNVDDEEDDEIRINKDYDLDPDLELLPTPPAILPQLDIKTTALTTIPSQQRTPILPPISAILEEEKRGATFRVQPTKTFKSNLQKAQNQPIFLIQQRPIRYVQPEAKESKTLKTSTISSTPNLVPEREFIILGTTGNVYTVKISTFPQCDCKENKKGKASSNCKHILFVFLRVLGVSPTDHCLYQRALLNSELSNIFSSATHNAPPVQSVLASAAATEKYLELTGSKKKKQVKQRPIEGDCPICFEKMKPTDKLVYCKYSCGNSIHTDCFKKWHQTKQEAATEEVKCIYCRARWDYSISSSVHMRNGYLNLQEFQHNSELSIQDSVSYIWILPEILRFSRQIGGVYETLVRGFHGSMHGDHQEDEEEEDSESDY